MKKKDVVSSILYTRDRIDLGDRCQLFFTWVSASLIRSGCRVYGSLADSFRNEDVMNVPFIRILSPRPVEIVTTELLKRAPSAARRSMFGVWFTFEPDVETACSAWASEKMNKMFGRGTGELSAAWLAVGRMAKAKVRQRMLSVRFMR